MRNDHFTSLYIINITSLIFNTYKQEVIMPRKILPIFHKLQPSRNVYLKECSTLPAIQNKHHLKA